MLAVGLPGFEGNLAVFNWVVGLLFIVRAVQNNGRWSEARKQARAGTEDDEARARIRAALRAADTHEE